MTANTPNTINTTFASFNLPEQMNVALSRMNYTVPTSIQTQAIPFAMAGRDVLGSAQTGTGKTAAFSIPMIAKLMLDPKAMALVLAPTRELASQTLDVVHKLTSNNRDMRTALLIGGEAMGKQFDQLRQNPRIIIGTPGRINDHLRRNSRMLQNVNFIAVDEADRMLDMGFSEQIDEIFAMVPKDRQMLMFSATFPESIIKFSRNYLNNPERVSVSMEKASIPKIKHDVVRTTDGEKYTHLLAELTARDGSIIVFVKTQHGTERLAKRLEHDDHGNVVIHGGLRQNQREKAVRAFRNQRARIMVATDVAARGLDIPHIEHVINYDLPQVAEDYIHRIGRTARHGAEGNAMCFVLPSETGKWNAINRILNPGEAPLRGERGSDSRPNRGGGSGGYKGKSNSGGYKNASSGFKRRDERPVFSRGNERSGGGDRPFVKKPYEKREWNNDRPSSDRPSFDSAGGDARRDGGKPFVKSSYAPRGDAPRGNDRGHDSKPTDRNWNNKEDRGTYTRPKEYKPEWRNEGRSTGEGRGDGRMDNNRAAETRGEPRGEKRGPTRRDDAPRGNNGQSRHVSTRSYFRTDDRTNAAPGRGRPADGYKGDRDGNNRGENRGFSKAPYKKDDRGGFKTEVRGDAPRKPKSDRPVAVKKPFKFKEHSRKPVRAVEKGRAAV